MAVPSAAALVFRFAWHGDVVVDVLCFGCLFVKCFGPATSSGPSGPLLVAV